MTVGGQALLTLNAGSSSFKFGLFSNSDQPEVRLRGAVTGIGGDARLKLKDASGKTLTDIDLHDSTTHGTALSRALELLPRYERFAGLAAVGHRIVFGGPGRSAPTALDEAVLRELEEFVPFAPLHQPFNLAGVRAAMDAFPGALQVGCFDTAFHRTQGWLQDTFALPREWFERGVRRYGFHGLSYDYIAGVLRERYPKLGAGRVLVAHLGNGASMCALSDGKSVDSTMGFTALDGLPMGTRCGQLDPGVVLYLVDQLSMTTAAVEDLLYRRSGLLGLSGESNDMRALLTSESEAAADAVRYFVSRVQREVGALTSVLQGLDGLVFTAGIGENSPEIRSRVCAGLRWLGVELDDVANERGDACISSDSSAVTVLALPTNEELVIARALRAALAGA
ncbi:MAG: acetate/propionate family kinase [Myxococcota bacterium]